MERVLTVRWKIDLALSCQEIVSLYKEKECQLIAALATKEIETRCDLPLDDAVAEQRPHCRVELRTTLRLELRLVLLRWDLDESLVEATVAVVTVVNHIEKVIEIKKIIKHAEKISVNQDGILIIS